MPLEPILIAGQIQLVPLPAVNDARERVRAAQERIRRIGVAKRRAYYEGVQYREENLDKLHALGLDVPNVSGDVDARNDRRMRFESRLPEHMRKHEYSSAIREAVDFLSDELSADFEADFEDETLQEIFDTVVKSSPQITGEGDGDEAALDDLMRDAMQAGDIPIEMVWDPVKKTVRWDPWESEMVDFEWDNMLTVTRVIRSQIIWTPVRPNSNNQQGIPYDSATGNQEWHQIVEQMIWELAWRTQPDGSRRLECKKERYIDYSEQPESTEWLGISVIPWGLLRIRHKLRWVRGESLISDQIMRHTDRYNANEQLAYLIARYNSHGKLAIVGDQSYLKLAYDNLQQEGGGAAVPTDVGDIIAMPGGTAVQGIQLPTNPQMIEHQRKELAESIYKAFGLARVDPDTIAAFSSVSGYALEILNRRTAGTFRSIKRFWLRDMRALINATFDIHAMKTTDGDWWTVDPEAIYDNRTVDIRMGSGYIVDHIAIRDDFAQQLVSRAEALREDGKSAEEITTIQQEIIDEQPEPPPVMMPGQTPSSPPAPKQALGAAGNGKGSQQGPKAGSTVGAGGA